MQVYAGPVSESVPSSITGFAYRSRADSTASFTYFQEDDDSPEWPDDAVLEDHSDEESILRRLSGEQIDKLSMHSKRRRSSEYSSGSVHEHLMRQGSRKTNPTLVESETRVNQKIYVVTEDLTIVVAGFTTRPLGFIVYLILCTISLGVGFLVFRWLPRWRVRLIGSPKPLQYCTWVVIEVRSIFHASETAPLLNLRRTNGVSLQFRTSPNPIMGILFPPFLDRQRRSKL